MALDEQMAAALAQRTRRGTRRALHLRDPTHAQTLATLTDFSSNDYLSLARDAGLRTRVAEAWRTSEAPLGSGGSRLLDGDSLLHTHTEQALATYFEAPDALLFNSGYDANVSLLTTLPQPGDVVVYDALVHASMHDGMRASRAHACVSFAHNDADALDQVLTELLAAHTPTNVFLAVESVYSMDGTICALDRLYRVLQKHVPHADARHILIDEAHGVGVYGRGGRGVCAALGMADVPTTRLMTFGKAWGCAGAVVLCSSLLRDYLVNYARPLIYSTALPPSQVVAIQAVLDAWQGNDLEARQRHVHQLVQRLHDALQQVGIRPPPRPSLPLPPAPIVPIRHATPKALAARLQAAGFLVRAVCYPTVPRDEERIRICVHAHNTMDEMQALARVLAWDASL
ncbi:8-amino-7-oxononanoate synthase [Malassezia pachydermatis]|uniref:8-amino-7-oxononanoate synthase n=1 Tax=Malassezia pachydermatis TaxID=77020 RepID=A0A0M8MTH8_9BASI|nr:8-amino-7-oxononanoate synthase [Malassezia pachydermatis]KOS13301.1 8-amino-7-oxononanoate synthase [Malassezia pachydermatis]